MLNIGIDLGGTNIAAGIVDESGRVLAKDSVPTQAGREAREIVADMAGLVNKLISGSGYSLDDIESVGVGAPGAIDRESGKVVFANNLFWHNVPLRDMLQETVNKPYYIENDANAAAVAELMIGQGRGYSDLLLLTLGTGIGGGIIINKRIIAGSHFVGAEVGHFIIQADGILCTCGNRGCFERYASATALAAAGKEALKSHPHSYIALSSGGDERNVTAKMVIDGAKQGDAAACAIFDHFIKYLALGIVSFINIFDPEVIILGGGVSNAGDFLLDAVRKKVYEYVVYKELSYAKVELSALGNDAGIIGAAFLRRVMAR